MTIISYTFMFLMKEKDQFWLSSSKYSKLYQHQQQQS